MEESPETNVLSTRSDLSSVRESSEAEDDREIQTFPYGFPMPFYLCEKYGGLPLAIREEDASPIEGYVWLDGQAYPVGVKITDTTGLENKSKPEHLDWVMTHKVEVVPGIALKDSEQLHPTLYYLLADNEFYPMACQDDNVPIEGYVHHPEDHSMLIPVGVQHYDESGKIVPQHVFCMDGRIRSGIPAHPQAGWSTHYVVSGNTRIPPGLSRQEVIPSPHSSSRESADSQAKEIETDTSVESVTQIGAICQEQDKKMSETERKITETLVDVGRSVKQQLAESAVPTTAYPAEVTSSSESEDVKEVPSVLASSSLDGTRVPDSYLDYDSTRHLTAASGETSSLTGSFTAPYNVVTVQTPPTNNSVTPLNGAQSSSGPTLQQGIIRHTKVLETRVPVIHQQTVEKVVEVKQPTQINTKTVEVPFTEDKILYKPHKQVVDVPVEVVKEIRKPITRPVEKVVHVPGHVVEIPKPYPVAKHVPKPIIQTKNQVWRIQESSKPVVVPQGQKEIECIRYEPEIHIVDVYIPKRITGSITQGRQQKTLKEIKDLSTPHWNTLVYKCNEALANGAEGTTGVACLPFIKNHPSGTISVLATNSLIGVPLGAPYLAEPVAELASTDTRIGTSGHTKTQSQAWSFSSPSTAQPLNSTLPPTMGPRILKPPSSFLPVVKAQPLYGKELMPYWWHEQQARNFPKSETIPSGSLSINAPIVVDKSELASPTNFKDCQEESEEEMKTADDFFVEAPADDDVSVRDFGCRRANNVKCASCWCF